MIHHLASLAFDIFIPQNLVLRVVREQKPSIALHALADLVNVLLVLGGRVPSEAHANHFVLAEVEPDMSKFDVKRARRKGKEKTQSC